MPKPVRELEEKRRPLEERVREFLAKHRENAYTLDEVIAGVEGGDEQNRQNLVLLMLILSESRVVDLRQSYEQALKKLAVLKRVRMFQENDATYYAVAGEQ